MRDLLDSKYTPYCLCIFVARDHSSLDVCFVSGSRHGCFIHTVLPKYQHSTKQCLIDYLQKMDLKDVYC